MIKNWDVYQALDKMFDLSYESVTQKDIEIHKTNEEDIKTLTHQDIIQPRESQIEALIELEKTIQEGYNKALIVMATGTGKTYLSGFFSKGFKKILFVVHREEILFQSKESFQLLFPNKKTGLYYSMQKDFDSDIIFASIYTLSNKRHLQKFSPEHFDLIVIDEFHHSAAKSYQNLINYFKPQFLLGITATPDRLDGKDIYAICDGNVAYKINFIEAIQRNWLCPFHYYGVYDDIDYSQIRWLGNRYDDTELVKFQLKEEVAEKIFNAWQKFKGSQSLAFCSSIQQAEYLLEFFKTKNIKCAAIHSRSIIKRSEAIQLITNNSIEIIFTVDLFNEGVDIPSIDTLLFVRPTESLTVFTQQIGRGLRLHNNKEYCVIIDLIGNYKNANLKFSIFSSEGNLENKDKNQIIPKVPESCKFDIDLKAINLLKELSKKKQPRKEKLKHSYFNLKNELGRRPTYLELHLKGEEPAISYKQEFKSYFSFLDWSNELNEIEKIIFNRYQNWIFDVENTGMTKSYKMVLLKYLLDIKKDFWNKPIKPNEVALFFHNYYMEKEYRKKIDFSDKTIKELWNYNETKVSQLIAKMPMTMWSGGSKGIVTFDKKEFTINVEVIEEHKIILYSWTKEICDYRLHQYFEKKEKSKQP